MSNTEGNGWQGGSRELVGLVRGERVKNQFINLSNNQQLKYKMTSAPGKKQKPTNKQKN
jgi:hypothetical protein